MRSSVLKAYPDGKKGLSTTVSRSAVTAPTSSMGSSTHCDRLKEHEYCKVRRYLKECGHLQGHGHSKVCGHRKEHGYGRVHTLQRARVRKVCGHCKKCRHLKERGCLTEHWYCKERGTAGRVGIAECMQVPHRLSVAQGMQEPHRLMSLQLSRPGLSLLQVEVELV